MLNSSQSKHNFYLNYDTYLVSSIGVLWAWRTTVNQNSLKNTLVSYLIGVIFGKIIVSFGRNSLFLDSENSKVSLFNFMISLLTPIVLFFVLFAILTYWKLATDGCPDC